MRILVVDRAWVEWIINLSLCEYGAPRMRGLFFCGDFDRRSRAGAGRRRCCLVGSKVLKT